MKAPCLNCLERHPLCHGHCQAYQKYSTERKKISQVKLSEIDINGYVIEAVYKNQKGRRMYA